MANTYEQIKALVDKGNEMGLSNTIKRDYGIPLDYSSVQASFEAALDYAKNNTRAYIGQPISVGDTLYIVTDEANNYLKAVGTKPAGDDKSITVAEDGTISIKGFQAADSATLPQKQSDGSIRWVAIDAIVSGDGNEKTRIAAATDSAISVTPVYDGETDTYNYTLDVTLPAIPNYTVTKTVEEGQVTYQVTKDGVATGEGIVVPNAYDDSAISGRVENAESEISGIKTTVGDHTSRIESIEAFFKDAAEDEGEGESLVNALDTLKEIQDYINNDGEVAETVTSNAAAIKILTGDAETDGSVENTVAKAIKTHADAASATYATQAELAGVSATAAAAAVKTEVDAALAKKIENATIGHTSEGITEGVTVEGTTLSIIVDSYTKAETMDAISDAVSSITGGSGETFPELLAAFNSYTTDNDARSTAIEAVNETQATAIQANADAIQAIKDPTTGILVSATAAAARDAQDKIDTLVSTGQVSSNTADIRAIQGNIQNINTTVGEHTAAIAGFQQKDNELDVAIKAEAAARAELSSTVNGHTTAITGLQEKDNSLEAAIAANTSKFDRYSTTADVESKIAAAVAGIDYTSLNTAIGKNADDIATEIDRATKAEADLGDRITQSVTSINAEIAALGTAINSVLENEDDTALNSIKELANWINEHDHDTDVLSAISSNTDAIGVLNGDEKTEGSVKKTVADAISGIPTADGTTAGLVKTSEEVVVDAEGVLRVGYVSTDKLVAGTNTWLLNGGTATTVTDSVTTQ